MKLSVWKDRPGRTRIVALLGNGEHMEARRYYYMQYHPEENIKGYRILQLDMNPWNFEETNLVKVTPKIMNCMLNNHLLSDDPQRNKMALATLMLEQMAKQAKDKI